MLRGNNHVFVITAQNCKCSMLQLAPFRFDLSRQYLYLLLIFSLCGICYSERYREIVGNSPTPVQKLSAICFKYYYCGWIYITEFFLLLIIGFSCFNFLQHKNTEQHNRDIILHTVYERWTRGRFEGQADCWERYWFTFGIQPVLKWLSFLWYGTHSVFEW